jgi:pre-mRNA-processing factor 40
LDELKASGKLSSGTKWKEVYPLFASDQRYLSLLGLPGSTPLELFWDAVDELDLALEGKVRDVERYLSSKGFVCTEQTTLEELENVFKGDEVVENRIGGDGPALFRHVSIRMK